MLLKWARAVNACQHINTYIEFGPGITALVGANGTGKTNFMELARATVTNDFSSMGGAKDVNIRRGKAEDEPSYVETCWSTPSGEVRIKRGLHRSQSSLSVNGVDREDLYGRENPITVAALGLLGTSADVFNDFMFADYKSLQTIIKGTTAERAKLFTSLCGVSVIAKLDDAIRMQLAADVAVCNEFKEAELDAELKIWGDLKHSRKVIKRRIDAAKAKQLSPKKYRDAVEDHTILSKVAEDIREARTTRDLVKDRLRKQEERLVTLTARVKEKKTGRTESQANLQVASDEVHRLTREIDAYSKVVAAAGAVATAKKSLRDAPPAPELHPQDELDRSELESLRSSVEQAGKAVKHELDVIEKSGQGKCETCGQAVDVSPARVKLLQQQRSKLQAEYVDTLHRITRTKENEARTRQFEQDKHQWELLQAKAVATIEANKELAAKLDPSVSLVDLRKQFETAKKSVESNKRWISECGIDIEETQQTLAAMQVRNEQDVQLLKNAREIIDGFEMPTEQQLKEVRDIVTEQDELRQELRDQEFQFGEKRKQIIDCIRRIRSLREKRRRNERLYACTDVLREARSVCGKDGLPAMVVNEMLDLTTERVNEMLERLSAKFFVRPDKDEFSFIAIHRDRSEEAAKRLSTGQGLCLGIAFWLARSATFAGRLPLFCLDEPTAHIDAAKLLDIADMFGRLAEELFNDNRQGIIITHDTAVATSCTRCFDLQQGIYINHHV